MNCELCNLVKNDGFVVTLCNHCNSTLVVGREHKPEFSDSEREMIKAIFPRGKVRWEMKKIRDHCHCHIL